jgi:hypothetical protein
MRKRVQPEAGFSYSEASKIERRRTRYSSSALLSLENPVFPLYTFELQTKMLPRLRSVKPLRAPAQHTWPGPRTGSFRSVVIWPSDRIRIAGAPETSGPVALDLSAAPMPPQMPQPSALPCITNVGA